MACARNLKALIIFELIDGKFVGFLITVQNVRQFALVNVLYINYSFFPKKSAFRMLIMPLPNLHIADICKLGKGIN
jgi:hypothetical protein